MVLVGMGGVCGWVGDYLFVVVVDLCGVVVVGGDCGVDCVVDWIWLGGVYGW